MTYAIIRGKNGRRHEVDFGDSPVCVEVYASDATIGIFVEADFESLPEERRRFALVNVSLAKLQAKPHAARQEKIAEIVPNNAVARLHQLVLAKDIIR